MAARGFAVLAAICLVCAVALGATLPAGEPLSQFFADIDGSWLALVEGFELAHLGGWAWQGVTVPLLTRPVWFIPLALGLVSVAAATSLGWRTPLRIRR